MLHEIGECDIHLSKRCWVLMAWRKGIADPDCRIALACQDSQVVRDIFLTSRKPCAPWIQTTEESERPMLATFEG